jgi:hypothetical protein
MTFNKLVQKKLTVMCLMGLLFTTVTLTAQSDIIFVSTDVSEWTIDGRVSTSMIDSTLAFVFSFDEDNPPLSRPDTVYLDLNSSVEVMNCDSVYVKYNSLHNLPTTDSWVAGDVTVLVKYPATQNWTEIYDEDLTHISDYVNELNLRLKVAVRSNPAEPGAYILHNVRFVGNCY